MVIDKVALVIRLFHGDTCSISFYNLVGINKDQPNEKSKD